jgi:DNA-binding transcriptional regulator of glucitol operon
MTGTAISIVVCVAAIWMTQRLLTIWQALRHRRQLMALREHGKLSVGMAKKIGRRVIVGLTFDEKGTVTDNLVFRGITVFADGRPNPALLGCRAVDLAAGRTPAGLPTLVAAAATHSASFIIGNKPGVAARPRRRPVPSAA